MLKTYTLFYHNCHFLTYHHLYTTIGLLFYVYCRCYDIVSSTGAVTSTASSSAAHSRNPSSDTIGNETAEGNNSNNSTTNTTGSGVGIATTDDVRILFISLFISTIYSISPTCTNTTDITTLLFSTVFLGRQQASQWCRQWKGSLRFCTGSSAHFTTQ